MDTQATERVTARKRDRKGVARSGGDRIATYVLIGDWLYAQAKLNPKRLHPYQLITKEIRSYRSMPRMDSAEVLVVRRAMSKARVYLQTKYRVGLRIVNGAARALLDDNEKIVEAKTTERRLKGSADAHQRSVNIIDPKKLSVESKRVYGRLSKEIHMMEHQLLHLLTEGSAEKQEKQEKP
jgi:hypothetical protein